ncbi:MAG TPA: type II secretion system protein GspC [Gammaproteobacteria bacterium]|nr:type II secretion system protein GspC [Gammaproteobacteria bacterium]
MHTLANKLPKALQVNALNLAQLNRILPPVVTLLFVIACSYTLSQITWAFFPDDTQQTNTPRNFSAGKPATQKAPDYRHISDAHLFGSFQQTTVKTSATVDAPETRLNLVLKGVLAATPMKFASAIISLGKNGKEDTYSIGEKVSSATLKEVYADKVILERGGRLETLRMPVTASKNLIKTVSSSQSSRGTARANTPGAVLSDIRKKIIKNPTSFGKYAIPIPYKENGKLRGFRLQAQGDRSLFDAVGLKTNDVVIALNGVELNDPSKGLKALRKLQNAKSVDLTILRDGAEIPLHFEIP